MSSLIQDSHLDNYSTSLGTASMDYYKQRLISEGPNKDGDNLRTFVVFNKLPPELRLKTWEHATDAVGARVLELRWKNKAPYFHTGPAPAVLYTCRESRKVAEKHYDKFDLRDELPRSLGFLIPCCTWIDYSRDVLYFSQAEIENEQYLVTLVQHFLIRLKDISNRQPKLQHVALVPKLKFCMYITRSLASFPNLKSINLVYSDACALDMNTRISDMETIPLQTIAGWPKKSPKDAEFRIESDKRMVPISLLDRFQDMKQVITVHFKRPNISAAVGRGIVVNPIKVKRL